MELPIIRVVDSDATALPMTLQYVLGANELDMKVVYATITGLCDHQGRPQLVNQAPEVFLDSFWSAAAYLLDYFADFYTTDTTVMHSVWFHLLDIWQTASPVYCLDDYSYHLDTSQLLALEKDYTDTLDIIRRLTSPESCAQQERQGNSIIYNPSGVVGGLDDCYHTGPFISGLKPWQQFLYSGSPGFRPYDAGPAASSPPTSTDTTAFTPTTRYIPQPAIAIIQAHTARARALTAKLAAAHPETLAETLSAFDARALPIPSTTHRTFITPSLLHPGKTFSYQLAQGAPPVKRHEGLTDPSMMVEKPDFNLLDEAVGSCQGKEAYVPMTGPLEQDGVGFDVWAVVERREGGRGGERGGLRGVGEMFDDWYFAEDDS